MLTDEKLLKRLLVTFRVEAQEHIQTIASGLIPLEKASTDAEQMPVLDTIFRSAHSLKGAARAVNMTDIEKVCQAIESIFAALKRKQISSSPTLFDLMHRAVTLLGELSSFSESGVSNVPKSKVAELVAALETTLQGGTVSAPVVSPPPPAVEEVRQPERQEKSTADTVRISVARLDAVMSQTEELLAVKLAANQRASGLHQIQSRFDEWEKHWAKLRADVRMFQKAVERKEAGNGANAQWQRVAEFLNWNQEFLETMQVEVVDAAKAADQSKRSTGVMVDHLLDEVKKAVMLPSSTLTDLFPRLVRELSRDQGKDVELIINGSEMEIDRRILEEMKDPLIHLVRNCLDHGMEKPEARVQRGKPARGTISISLSPVNGSHVEFLIVDDGNGIDAEKVRGTATKLGLLPADKLAALAEKEVLALIFESGVSTSPIITDISGRGLGLAIVKEKADKLNGVLSVETQMGKGTTFRIVLPLTLSRFRGVAMRVQERLFIAPTGNVERVVRLKKEEIKTVENRETISIGDQALALARLNRVLALPPEVNAPEAGNILPAIILVASGQRMAFLVDEVFDEEEILVKPLGRQLARVRNIAGATIAENGKVIPILNVSDLMQSAVRTAAAGGAAVAAPTKAAEEQKKSILVAEDSITSRSLLKNILEAAGYQVETAVDGVDAFTKLRSGQFDVVVSDVDMPRMNGFGLTAKIRSDKKLAELPVILVTSLNSRTDREHGIDVGANAYIVKSDFDQSNLLETIRRLI